MSEDAVDVVREAIAALNERDVERYLSQCTEDIVLVTPTAGLEGSDVGADGVRAFFARLDEGAPTFHLQIARLHEVSPGVVLANLGLEIASERGVRMEQPLHNVYRVRAGKLARVQVFTDPAEAEAEASSAQSPE